MKNSSGVQMTGGGYIEPSVRDEWEIPQAETPGSEPLPDLPTENVEQFIGRMKRDFDLTNI